MYEEVSASNLVKIDVDGNVVDLGSTARVNKAGFTIHGSIHANVDHAHAVFHCHTVPGVAVGAQKTGLLPLSFQALFLYGQVGYHDLEGVTIEPGEVPRMLAALKGNKALMLRNHGTLVAGPTVAEAFFLLFSLEKACAIQIAAQSAGGELVVPAEGMADHFRGQVAGSFADIAQLSWRRSGARRTGSPPAIGTRVPLND